MSSGISAPALLKDWFLSALRAEALTVVYPAQPGILCSFPVGTVCVYVYLSAFFFLTSSSSSSSPNDNKLKKKKRSPARRNYLLFSFSPPPSLLFFFPPGFILLSSSATKRKLSAIYFLFQFPNGPAPRSGPLSVILSLYQPTSRREACRARR